MAFPLQLKTLSVKDHLLVKRIQALWLLAQVVFVEGARSHSLFRLLFVSLVVHFREWVVTYDVLAKV